MYKRPLLLTAALLLTVPALATGGGELGTCDEGTLTYEMGNIKDGSIKRVIWGPDMFCKGTISYLEIQSGNVLSRNDELTFGTFVGTAKLVKGGCASTGDFAIGAVWDVSLALGPKNTTVGGGKVATVPKIEGPYKTEAAANSADWDLMLVNSSLTEAGTTYISELTSPSGNNWVVIKTMPTNLKYGNQIGEYANVKTPGLGGAFWFGWERYRSTGDTFALMAASGKDGHRSHGDFNYTLEVTCEPGDSCPVDSDAPLGPASDYNLYVIGDMDANNADVGGLTAVGGSATIKNYGLNSGWNVGAAITVGDDFSATDSQLYGSGESQVGGTYTGTRVGNPSGTLVDELGSSLDFDAGSADNTAAIAAILDWADGLEDTGTVSLNRWWPQLIVDGRGSSGLNVVSFDSCDIQDTIEDKWSWASDIQGYDIKGDTGSTLLINVYGDCDSMLFKNGHMAVGGGLSRNNVIWAFHEMPSITVKNVSLQGAFFGPDTDVTSMSANFDGTVVAASFSGSGEPHKVDFTGDICPTDGGGESR